MLILLYLPREIPEKLSIPDNADIFVSKIENLYLKTFCVSVVFPSFMEVKSHFGKKLLSAIL